MRISLLFKIILFSLLVPGTVTLLIPYALLRDADGTLPATHLLSASPAAVGMMAGVAIYLRCVWDFAVSGLGTPAPLDPPKKLVVSGLYRRNRNPMYLGVLLILLAECLLFLDRNLLIYASTVALILNSFVVFYEEPILNQKFGESYREYCRQVSRWGIRLRAYSVNSD